ncbi:RNA-binding protein rnc1 like [Verticillium longisporum]|nr:RNA-binding protein rnc1 like [Verticillium longisporum]
MSLVGLICHGTLPSPGRVQFVPPSPIQNCAGRVIKINEPQDNSNERLVTITGTDETNRMALYMLYSRLESEKHRIEQSRYGSHIVRNILFSAFGFAWAGGGGATRMSCVSLRSLDGVIPREGTPFNSRLSLSNPFLPCLASRCTSSPMPSPTLARGTDFAAAERRKANPGAFAESKLA